MGIGVSVDGNKSAHDARRLTKVGGLGTYKQVMRGLDNLRDPDYASLYQALLCVVNIDSDPLEVYEAMLALKPPKIDYLLPHATHDDPPAQPKDPNRQSPTAYAEWLLPIFWRWIGQQHAPDIRLFSSIMQLRLGGKSSTESIGPDTGGEVVVRTDGSLELVDALKVTGEGAVATNMNVTTHDLEQVAQFMRRYHQLGKKAVAGACQDCTFVNSCGGGHIAQRHSDERGFDSSSVYCEDLKLLISDINMATDSRLESGMAYTLKLRGVKPPEGHNDCYQPPFLYDHPPWQETITVRSTNVL